jgi:hypothetical protein
MNTVLALFATIPFVNYCWRTDLCYPHAPIENAASATMVDRLSYFRRHLGQTKLSSQTIDDMAKAIDHILPLILQPDFTKILGLVPADLIEGDGYHLTTKRHGRFVDAFVLSAALDRILAASIPDCNGNIRQSLHPASSSSPGVLEPMDYSPHFQNIRAFQHAYQIANAIPGADVWSKVLGGQSETAAVIGMSCASSEAQAYSRLFMVISNIFAFSNGLLLLSKVSL